MKFGETFESHLTIEWRKQYINYMELKGMIRKAVDNAPPPNQKSLVYEYYQKFSEEFFSKLKEELRRVNDFFDYKLAEARRKHATFKVKLMYIFRGEDTGEMPSLPPLEGQPKSVRKLERAYSEFYFGLVLLNNYQQLNLTGFHKICKKYDKYIRSINGQYWLKTYVKPAVISQEGELRTMLAEVENLYTEFMAKGDRNKAIAKLRVPPLGKPISPIHVFSTGLVLGLFIVSTAICIVSYYFLLDKPELLSAFIQLFRGSFALMVFGLLTSINVYVWQNVGINHVLIFELNPRNQIEPIKILGVASLFGYVCTLSMLLFLHHNEFGVSDPLFFPLIGVILPLVMLINPLPIMNHPARMWVLCIFGRIIAAPFYPVNFIDFWLADQLNSLVLCLIDHYQLFRFYIRYYKESINSLDFEPDYAMTVIRCLPSWFRLAQCLKRIFDGDPKPVSYLVNAFTYGSTIITVIISTIQMETSAEYESLLENPWTWIYVITSFISSIYCTFWDLLQDYGLFQVWKGEHIFLRDNLIYPKWFYYLAIVLDALIRFVWALEMYLIYNEFLLPYNSKTICSLLEIIRRFIWNFLRLENEHLYNCGQFRATRDIYISALNSRQDLLVESIIDESRRASTAPPTNLSTE